MRPDRPTACVNMRVAEKEGFKCVVFVFFPIVVDDFTSGEVGLNYRIFTQERWRFIRTLHLNRFELI